MANSKLEIQVEVDSSGAIKGLQLVQQQVAKVTEQTKQVGQGVSFEGFANQVKAGISDPLAAAGDAAKELLTSLGPVGSGIAAGATAFAAFTAAGYSAAKSLGELGDRVSDTAVRMGLTVKEVGQFNFAMKLAGSDGISTLEPAMKRLSQALDDGSAEGKKARESMRDIGVQTRDAAGNVRPMSQVFEDLSAKLNAMTDTAKRNSAAIAILGRSGLEVLPDLLELSAGLQRARQLGIGPSQEDVDRWNKYQKEIAEVDAAWERLKRKFKEPLAASISFLIRYSSTAEGTTIDELKKRGYNIAGAPGPASTSDFAATAAAQGFRLRTDTTQQQRLYEYADQLSQIVPVPPLPRTTEGDQAKLETLKEAATKARTAYESLGPTAIDSTIRQLRDNLNKATAEYERFKLVVEAEVKAPEQLKEFNKQLFAIQQTAELKPFGDLGAIEARRRDQIRAVQESALPPSEKSRLTAGFDQAFGRELAAEAQKMALAFREVTNAFTDFTSKAAGKSAYELVDQGLRTLLRDFDEELKTGQQIAGIRDNAAREDVVRRASRAQQIAGLTNLRPEDAIQAGYASQIALANELYRLDQKRAQDEFVWTGDEIKLRIDGEKSLADQRKAYQDAALEREIKILELQKSRIDAIRNTTEGLLHTLFTDPSNFGSRFATTIRDAALKPIETGLANLATQKLYPAIFGGDGVGGINGLLGGIFGKQSNPLQVATDANTAATLANTAALQGFTLGTAGGGLFGGGNLGGGVFSFGGLTDQLGLPVAGIPSIGPLISQRSAGGFTGLTGLPGIAGLLGIRDRSVNIPGLPTNTLSNLIGTGIQIAGGTGELISGLSQGGARGDLTAAGGAAATAGGLLALLGGSMALAGPIGAAIGVALPLITSLFPDQKKARSEAIDTELQNARYTAATPQTYTMDVAGSAIDYSYSGQARTTVINNYNVSTMDASSFSDWLHGKGPVVASVVTQQLNTHGPLQNGIRSTVNPN